MTQFLDLSAAQAALADPATPPEQLSAIAQQYPELAAQIAGHPHVYPDLLLWLQQYAGLDPSPIEGQPVTAAIGTNDPPTQPQRDSRAVAIVLVLLIIGTAAAAIFAVLLYLQRSEDQESAASPPAATASSEEPTAETGSAQPSPDELEPPSNPTSDAEPTPVVEPEPESSVEPSPAPTRSVFDEEYCGQTGTVLAVGMTADFEVRICDDGGLTYYGVHLDSGSDIYLPAYNDSSGGGFGADNEGVHYSVTSERLHVTDSSGVLLEQEFLSWREWE